MKTFLHLMQTKVTSLLAVFLFILAVSAHSQVVNNDAVRNFTVIQSDTRVTLSWSASAELNLSHFILEKSYNGKDFKDAGLIFTYGKEAAKSDYLFPDQALNSKTTVSYRLVLVEPGGKYSYSKTYSFNLNQHS